jgi:lysophospholipase L1-like esterase
MSSTTIRRAIYNPALVQRVADFYRGVAILTLNTLVLFACLELAALGVLEIWSVFSNPAEKEGDPREEVSYFASQDWAAQFWTEFKRSRRTRYHPYVLWRRAPFQGTTININQDGIRLTPGADYSAGSYKVFTFGGSTIWGTGSPDWGTIPAYLQADLEALTGMPVGVVNFGESGYVSTQGVIELIRQLESGNVPDLVLFYGSANDIYAAYQIGRAGVHQEFERIAAKFNGEEKRAHPFVEWIKQSYSFSLLRLVVASLKPVSQMDLKLVNYETMGVDVATLSDSVVQSYLNAYKIMDALAQAYGFHYYFFWAPVVYVGEKPLTSEEQKFKAEGDPALRKLYDAVYQKIELVAPKYVNSYSKTYIFDGYTSLLWIDDEYANLHSMTHIFDGYISLLWIDDAHTTAVGNQLIAKKMLEVITKRYSVSDLKATGSRSR